MDTRRDEPIGWELYRSFLSVLQEGSLSGAARALGITQPTVGRHIATLERAFRTTLFTRYQRGLIPTDTALALRGDAEAMSATAASLERTAASQGEGVAGVVRVSASEIIGVEVLPPIIARLRERHPRLKVELMLSNRMQDLLNREADIAIRMAPPRQDRLVARRIGQIEVGLHAREDYLARCGIPRKPGELAQHTVIGYDRLSAFVRKASRSFQSLDRETFSLRSDSDLAQLALIRAGAGIGFCQVPLAKRQADLRRVLPEAVSLKLDTWVAMIEDYRNSPRCRATFDAMVEGLRAHVAAG